MWMLRLPLVERRKVRRFWGFSLLSRGYRPDRGGPLAQESPAWALVRFSRSWGTLGTSLGRTGLCSMLEMHFREHLPSRHFSE
jgi:hypothetical protein